MGRMAKAKLIIEYMQAMPLRDLENIQQQSLYFYKLTMKDDSIDDSQEANEGVWKGSIDAIRRNMKSDIQVLDNKIDANNKKLEKQLEANARSIEQVANSVQLILDKLDGKGDGQA